MKLCLPLLIFLAIPFFAIAQSQDSANNNHFDVHFTPSTLVDFNPRIRAGLAYKDGNRGYTLDLGYGCHYLGLKWDRQVPYTENYKFYEVRGEMKFYSANLSDEDNFMYGAIEIYHIRHTDLFRTGSYLDPAGYKESEFIKNKTGISYKLGVESLIFQRIKLDIYIGLGLAYRHIDYDNGTKYEIDDDEDNISSTEDGWVILPQIPAGIRIGYVFWGKNKTDKL